MIGQGERYYYGDTENVDNPERALATGTSEPGASAPLASAALATVRADTAQAAADAAQASADAAAGLAAQSIVPLRLYDFGQASDQGWTFVAATAADAEFSTCRRITGSGPNPALVLSGLALAASSSFIVALRVKLVSGAWRGDLYWGNAGHDAVEPYKVTRPAPPVGVWTVLVFDLRVADFMGAALTKLQFHPTSDAGVLDVDWIAIGKLGTLAADLSNAQVAQLSDITPNPGTLTGGAMQDVAGAVKVDMGNSRIVFDNGTVVKITGVGFGSTGQFIEWAGLRSGIVSGGVVNVALCTQANAIQYLTVTGDAYFGGTLSAGVLKNGAKSTIKTTGLVLTVGPFDTNGGSRSVVLSFQLSQYGEQAGNHVESGTTNATIELHRTVNGGAPTLIATLNDSDGWTSSYDVDFLRSSFLSNMTGTLTVTDSTGAAGDDIEYTATITSRTVSQAGWTMRVDLQETSIISTE
jgi:hypothetical protein